MLKKLIVIILLLLAVTAYFYFDLRSVLSLEYFKAKQAGFAAGYAATPALFIAGFFAIYVLVTAFSLPGAAILTLAAGALFDLVTGTVVVSFASTIGATLAFLSSRFVLRDWVQDKFAARLQGVNAGLERDGAFYLFTLRLIPAVPFFVVNLAMGLTKIRVGTYYWVSQIGMLAGTIVFVNAGTQLAKINSLAGLLTPKLWASFAALALFPWIAKSFIAALKSRRVYRRYSQPKHFDRNLIVLGGGAAGLVSSYIAAMVKAKVTLIEAHAMGGDCLNTGCVPSKALIKTARVANAVGMADQYGVRTAKPTIDFPAVMARIKSVIAEIEPHDSVERFTGLGVDCVKGYAKFIDPWTVDISKGDGTTARMTARNFIIATGAAPHVPPLPGVESSGYLTSETMWDALSQRGEIPARITIMGGGPIGCELAQSFQRLGSQVTVIEMAERLLAKEDKDAAAIIEAHLRDCGVDVKLQHTALRFDGGNTLIAQGPDGEVAVPYDALIIATGRRARVTGFGLEELGLLDDGIMTLDDNLAAKMPHIYAAGDVAGRQQLTHGASHEAWYATVNALASPFKKYRADYRVLPRVTYTDPEVASVGLTEEQATLQGTAFEVTRYDLSDLDRAITEGETAGFVKILTPVGKETILGVTIVASHAGEMIAQFVLAMKHNMKLGQIAAAVLPYPTWNEANKYAVGAHKLARKPEKLLMLAQRYFTWRRGYTKVR